MTRFRTGSGSLYELDGATITRLSEEPMTDGRGAPLTTVLHRAPYTDARPLVVGRGFRAVVDGIPLHTSPVTEVLS